MTDPRTEVSAALISDCLEAAAEFADSMSARIREIVAGGIEVQAKADQSLVTSADTAAENVFRDAVMARFPEHGILGEEFPAIAENADFLWVVDPIDGTAEFARGLPLWGIIIGLYYKYEPLVGLLDHPDLKLRASAGYGLGTRINGEPVQVAPMAAGEINGRERVGTPSRFNYAKREGQGELFDRLSHAHPNIRVFHTCYTHLLAASGGLDAAIEWNAPLWDVAASRILIEEAGGEYRCLERHRNADAVELYNVVFGRPGLVERIAVVLRG